MIGPACGIYGVRCSVKCFRVQSSGIWSFLWNGWGPTISELFLSLECSGIKLGSNWLSFRGVWSQRVLSFFVRCYMIGSVCHMNLYWSFHVWYHMVLERSFLWNNLGQRPHGWSCWWNVWASKVPVFSLECLGLERSWLALPWRVWTETYSFNPFSLEFLAVCVCPFSGTSGGRQLVIGSALLRFQIFGVTQFAILFLWSVCGRDFIWSVCLWLFLDRTVCPSPGVFGVRKPVIAQATGVFHWCFSSVWDQTVPDWSCF